MARLSVQARMAAAGGPKGQQFDAVVATLDALVSNKKVDSSIVSLETLVQTSNLNSSVVTLDVLIQN